MLFNTIISLGLWHYSLLIRSAFSNHFVHPDVKQATAANFRAITADTFHPVLVVFHSPTCPHCRNFAPVFKDLAQELSGQCTFAAVECSAPESGQLCNLHGVRGVPSIKLFSSLQSNPKMRKTTNFNDDYKRKDLLKKLISDNVVSYAVSITENDANWSLPGFHSSASFFGENRHLPKVVLFTQKRDVILSLKSLSLHYKDKIQFAQVSCQRDARLCQELGCHDQRKHPILKLARPGATGWKDTEEYDGEKKFRKFKSYLEIWLMKPPSNRPESDVVASKPVHIQDSAAFDRLCRNASLPCLIALLPEPGASQHQEYVAVLDRLQSKISGSRNQLVYITDPEAQAQIFKHYEMSPVLPHAVLVSFPSNEHAVFVGAWDDGKLEAFLVSVESGKLGRVKKGSSLVLDWMKARGVHQDL